MADSRADPNASSSIPEPSSNPRPDLIMKNLIANKSTGENIVIRSISSYSDALQRLTNHWMASRLRADQYEAYVCTTQWEVKNQGRSHKATHNFIEIEGIPGNEELGETLIVDFYFKSQFSIMKSSKLYTLLISCLPNIFVGSKEKLKAVIEWFCWLARPSMTVKDITCNLPVYLKNKWLTPDRKTFPRRLSL